MVLRWRGPRRAVLALTLFCASASGCASWVAASAGTTIDTDVHPGGEVRGDAGGAMGAKWFRLYGSGTLAAGYDERNGSGYGGLGGEVGVEGGGDVQYAAGVREEVRLLPAGDPAGVLGLGLTGQVIGRVGPAEDDHGGFFIGARVLGEAVLPLTDDESRAEGYARFGGSFVLRYVFSDSSGQKPPM